MFGNAFPGHHASIQETEMLTGILNDQGLGLVPIRSAAARRVIATAPKTQTPVRPEEAG